jgi:hypothetical protein
MAKILIGLTNRDLGYFQRDEDGTLYWQVRPVPTGTNYLPLIFVVVLIFTIIEGLEVAFDAGLLPV